MELKGEEKHLLKFLLVGIISSCTALLFTTLFTSLLGIFYAVSALIALEISIFFAFIAHDKWTFSHVAKATKTINRFVKFNVGSLAGFGLNELILVSLTTWLNLNYVISEGIAILVTFIFNFMFSKKIVWRNRSNVN